MELEASTQYDESNYDSHDDSSRYSSNNGSVKDYDDSTSESSSNYGDSRIA